MDASINVNEQATVSLHGVDREGLDKKIPRLEWKQMTGFQYAYIVIGGVQIKFFANIV